MKTTLLLTYCLLMYVITKSQEFQASYKVESSESIGTGVNKQTIAFTSTCTIWVCNKQKISYFKPAYLQTYPTGQIIFNEVDKFTIYTICTDTLQWVFYEDEEKDIIVTRLNKYFSENNRFSKNTIPKTYTPEEWQLIPEYKEINGLVCQKAMLYARDLENVLSPYWTIWFYADIKMPYAFSGLRKPPGLIVEATSHFINEQYKLESFAINTVCKESLPLPQELLLILK